MAVTFPDDFAPEFAMVDPALAAGWITAAECAIDSARWLAAGKDPDVGVILKASHLMKLAGLGTGPALPADAIISESRGGKSVTRATSSSATAAHGSTVYGQALDNILASLGARRRSNLGPGPVPSCL